MQLRVGESEAESSVGEKDKEESDMTLREV